MEPFSLKLKNLYICEKEQKKFIPGLRSIILFLNISTALFIVILYFKLNEIGNDP